MLRTDAAGDKLVIKMLSLAGQMRRRVLRRDEAFYTAVFQTRLMTADLQQTSTDFQAVVKLKHGHTGGLLEVMTSVLKRAPSQTNLYLVTLELRHLRIVRSRSSWDM